jgi:hypothetical protein
MATSILRGTIVTCQDIQRAINEFDELYPTDSNGYDSWLDKGIYKWALRRNDRLYPPKYVLTLATGIPTTDFVASEARRVFGNLGFEIIRKP